MNNGNNRTIKDLSYRILVTATTSHAFLHRFVCICLQHNFHTYLQTNMQLTLPLPLPLFISYFIFMALFASVWVVCVCVDCCNRLMLLPLTCFSVFVMLCNVCILKFCARCLLLCESCLSYRCHRCCYFVYSCVATLCWYCCGICGCGFLIGAFFLALQLLFYWHLIRNTRTHISAYYFCCESPFLFYSWLSCTSCVSSMEMRFAFLFFKFTKLLKWT